MPLSLVTSWISTSAQEGAAKNRVPSSATTAEARVFSKSCLMWIMSVLNRIGGKPIRRDGVICPEILDCDVEDVVGGDLLDAVGPLGDILDGAARGQRDAVD